MTNEHQIRSIPCLYVYNVISWLKRMDNPAPQAKLNKLVTHLAQLVAFRLIA